MRAKNATAYHDVSGGSNGVHQVWSQADSSDFSTRAIVDKLRSPLPLQPDVEGVKYQLRGHQCIVFPLQQVTLQLLVNTSER